MTPLLLLALAVCSAAGAVARYLLDRAVTSAVLRRRRSTGQDGGRPPAPWGIGLVNACGAFALGLLAGHARDGTGSGAVPVSPEALALVGTGFLGSFTTFSTLAVDTVRLWGAGRRRAAVADAAGTVVVGLVLAGAGYALTR